MTSYQLDSPALDFGADGVPRSSTFDDVYFDKDAGLEETRYVFLAHNHLAERFQSLTDQARFHIAETGFGTGMNFLCALQLFAEQAPDSAWLTFTSVEKFPLSKDKLEQALAMWPSLAPFAQALLAQYPILCHGLHRIELPDFRTTLTLWFGEASEGFAALNGHIDAWFLDGFAPSKNPEMWSAELFQNIQRLSRHNTTFATFTAAGIVRRGLQAHGFNVQKVKGFGHKREMMVGQLSNSVTDTTPSPQAPWFEVTQAPSSYNRILVVGTGLAGATTANTLAQKGFQVEVWEQSDHIAEGASGNEQGMLYPKLGASDTPVNRFYLAAYLYAQRFYQTLSAAHPEATLWQQSGLLQRPKTPQEQVKFDKILATQLYPDSILRRSEDQAGLMLPLSGWARPKTICQTLLSHANIELKLNHELSRLEPSETGLTAYQGEHAHEFSHVIVCSANQQHMLDSIQTLPTKAIRGQVTQLSIKDIPDAHTQAQAEALSQVVCADGYVSPALEGQLNFGATYDLNSTSLAILEDSHKENLAKLERLLDCDLDQVALSDCRGRSALRCTVNDYTPIVGPISDQASLIEQYGMLRTNAKWQSTQPAAFVKGLFVNIGHGSRGLVSAPLCANYLASIIAEEVAPLEQTVLEALHPNRFVIRKLKRGEV
nr:bifunctional tRNA (5-methylaminomethyl-2-thiouridine)(34)-methyltransferase MnmD/FAD-dependent 5-carboxymethylaminomethyl-2-thiouridine(34) oxidoreductase MnmC [Marinomonas ostreistagni]